ncbi:glycoside hydrolase family 36 N-terminal domain-containing protein [Agromyces albus]|uniref:glycoside hydrolase family 36 N-terminal domain-containing protein n=1 Tax=Agromyces albus TaxID=205332 RepID=UPI0027D83981|nr:glycoside hydrolase family 36 N-terminal domain-containing protein [Agromyces albus]
MSTQARLRTRTTEYVVSVLPDGSGLVLDHWGELVDGPVEAWSEPDRIVSFATTADAAPLEFASAGQRHVQFSELLVDRGDGWLGAAWTLRGELETVSSVDGTGLTAEFADETGTLVLVLEYETSTRHDVVRRRMTVRNEGTTRIELPAPSLPGGTCHSARRCTSTTSQGGGRPSSSGARSSCSGARSRSAAGRA